MLYRSVVCYFSRPILLSIYDHVHFGSADATTIYPRNLELRTNFQGSDCVDENLRRDSGIN